MNKKRLAGFLQGKNRRTLPTKSSIPIVAASIGNHVKRNLTHLLRISGCGSKARCKEDSTHDARKGKPSQEQVRALLILPNLAKGDSAWSVPPLFWCGCISTRRGISACVVVGGGEHQRTTIHANI